MKWVEAHVGRGSFVFVEGELAYLQWQDKYQQQRERAYVVIRGPQGRIYPLRAGKEEKERMQEIILAPVNQNIKEESTTLSQGECIWRKTSI